MTNCFVMSEGILCHVCLLNGAIIKNYLLVTLIHLLFMQSSITKLYELLKDPEILGQIDNQIIKSLIVDAVKERGHQTVSPFAWEREVWAKSLAALSDRITKHERVTLESLASKAIFSDEELKILKELNLT